MTSITAAFLLSLLMTSAFETVDARRLNRDELKKSNQGLGTDDEEDRGRPGTSNDEQTEEDEQTISNHNRGRPRTSNDEQTERFDEPFDEPFDEQTEEGQAEYDSAEEAAEAEYDYAEEAPEEAAGTLENLDWRPSGRKLLGAAAIAGLALGAVAQAPGAEPGTYVLPLGNQARSFDATAIKGWDDILERAFRETKLVGASPSVKAYYPWEDILQRATDEATKASDTTFESLAEKALAYKKLAKEARDQQTQENMEFAAARIKSTAGTAKYAADKAIKAKVNVVSKYLEWAQMSLNQANRGSTGVLGWLLPGLAQDEPIAARKAVQEAALEHVSALDLARKLTAVAHQTANAAKEAAEGLSDLAGAPHLEPDQPKG